MNDSDFEKRLQRQPLRELPQEWRADILRAAKSAGAQSSIPGSASSWLLKPWRELIWPARRVWLGFAFVWVAIVAVNFADAEKSEHLEVRAKAPPTNLITVWQRQQELLTELNRPESPDLDKPRHSLPKPRSDRRPTEATV